MRTIKASLLILFLLIASSALAATKTVEGSTTGKVYNELLGRWIEKKITVYVDNKGNTYIMPSDTVLPVRGVLTPAERRKAIALLEKSLKWSDTARKNKLETTKKLGSFMKSFDYQEYGVSLTFFSANQGKQTSVILHLKDFDNMFAEEELYLDPKEVKGLIALLKRAPLTVKKLKKEAKKADELLR